jgi:hypothetical protein
VKVWENGRMSSNLMNLGIDIGTIDGGFVLEFVCMRFREEKDYGVGSTTHGSWCQ